MYQGGKPGAIIVLHADFSFALHAPLIKWMISYCCVKPAEFQGVVYTPFKSIAVGECNFIVSTDAVIAIRILALECPK